MTLRIDAGPASRAIELLREQQLSPDPVLARAGLDTATLSRKGARIPFAAHVSVLELSATAASDPCFGLHLGAALYPHDLGLLGYLGVNAATLGDALRGAIRYLRVLTEGEAGEFVRQGTSFKALADDIRRDLARRYLIRTSHRPKAIAALLGYRDASTFHHAFRRWTDMTPAQFRDDQRALSLRP